MQLIKISSKNHKFAYCRLVPCKKYQKLWTDIHSIFEPKEQHVREEEEDHPIGITNAGDGTNRLKIHEKKHFINFSKKQACRAGCRRRPFPMQLHQKGEKENMQNSFTLKDIKIA